MCNIKLAFIVTITLLFHCAYGIEPELRVKHAWTRKEKARGLMYLARLPEDRGMLFHYPIPTQVSFWSKNTHFNLSLALIDHKNEIIEIQNLPASVPPTIVSSYFLVSHVLEVNQGWFERNNISVGDRIVWSPKSERVKFIKTLNN